MLSLKRVIITVGLLSLALAPGAPAAPVHAASYVVNTLADSGLGSLRQAILDANVAVGADTITFSVSGTIVLATALPDITDGAGLVIDGSGQAVTVSGNRAVRPFRVNLGAAADLRSLTVTQGMAREADGGGVFNLGTLVVRNSAILDSSVTVGLLCLPYPPYTCFGIGGLGSGIYNGGTLAMAESSINGNTSDITGGGIYSEGTLSGLTVLDSTVSGNIGGGVVIGYGSTSTLVSSTISGNNGGGMQNRGKLTMTDSTLAANYGEVGGIYNQGELTIANSTVVGNYGTFSCGGISHEYGVLMVTHSTIVANHALTGGGICSVSPISATVSNSILANEASASPDCWGMVTLAGPNLITNPTGCTITGTPPITGDPKLGPLANNGGPTRTHALLAGSPAIDAGDDAVCAAPPVNGKDQRGVTRPQGAHCDLGAFELASLVPVVGGKNLRITTGSIDLSWDGGTAQTGYTLLKYNAITSTSTFVPLPANATSYSDASAVPGGMYCYALAAKGAGDVVLGLSDLECAMSGIKVGNPIPGNFALTLNQTPNATLTWGTPSGGADAYLLQRLPLDGSPPTSVHLAGGDTSSSQAVPPAGTCFLLVAYKAAAWGASDALCGIPSFSTLGNQANHTVQTVGAAMTDVQQRLATVAMPVIVER